MASPTRGELVADAALRVLGSHGARGLTHRAVDQEAGLPEGSVSNLHRSRASLLAAANARLAEADLRELRAAAAAIGTEALTPVHAAAGLAGVIERWTSEGAVLSMARLELYFEASRTPEYAGGLVEARGAFLGLAVELLGVLGCEDPVRYARPTVAFIDGLVVNQLLHAATALNAAELRRALVLWLEMCCAGDA